MMPGVGLGMGLGMIIRGNHLGGDRDAPPRGNQRDQRDQRDQRGNLIEGGNNQLGGHQVGGNQVGGNNRHMGDMGHDGLPPQALAPGQGLEPGLAPGQGLGPDHPPYDPAARLSGGELMAMIESDSGKHGSYSNPPRSDTLCCSV